MSADLHGTSDEPATGPRDGAALSYQRCRACRNIWYFRRDFCPRCGTAELETLGRQAVAAPSMRPRLVNRAPSEALRALAPYRILIVDAAGGIPPHGATASLIFRSAMPLRHGSQTFGLLLIPISNARNAHHDRASFETALDPRSIAVIGASENPNKIGGRPLALPGSVRLPRARLSDQSQAHRGSGPEDLSAPAATSRKRPISRSSRSRATPRSRRWTNAATPA